MKTFWKVHVFLMFLILTSEICFGRSNNNRRKFRQPWHGKQKSLTGLLKKGKLDPMFEGVQIIKSSNFAQTYKLGYKILLVCIAKGKPRPRINWYKDGSELHPKINSHVSEKILGKYLIKSKIEIDPATIGDKGIYICSANNQHAYDAKHFKIDYYY